MKESSFKWLDFKITNRCNNKCMYCGVKQDPPGAKDVLNAETIAKTLDNALNIGFSHFALLGGEPSLRNDFDILLKPLQKGSRFNTLMIITNLLIFNERMYCECFKTNSDIAQIVVSLDSLKIPNYKNQNPRKILKHIDKIQEIAKNYSNLGERKVHIHSVISRENFDRLIEHVNFFDELGLDVSLAFVEPFKIVNSNSEIKNDDFNVFSVDEINKVISQLKLLDAQNKLSWANKVLLDYIIKVMNRNLINFKECTAGINHVIIESNGYVYPCLTESYNRGLNFGNIRQESFKEIYLKMSSFKCESNFSQTCWDHFLWTHLERLYNDSNRLKIIKNDSKNTNPKGKKYKYKRQHLNSSDISSNQSNVRDKFEIISPLNLPDKLVIEISAKCNLNCIMCGFNTRSNFHGGFISEDIIDRILTEKRFFKKLKEIRLNGRGESTLHPKFINIINKLKKKYKKQSLTIFTNLMFPNNQILDEILKNKLYLFISIDGPTKNIYENIRIGANYNKLIERMELLQNYKNKFIVATIQIANLNYLYDLSKFAWKYGADIIFNVFRTDNKAIREQFRSMIIRNYDRIVNDFIRMKNDFPDISILIPDQICGISIPNYVNTAISCGCIKECPNAFNEIMIAYDGNVYPCNMFNPYNLGNVLEDPIEKIWNGFKNRTFLKIYKNLEYCKNCSFLIERRGP
ncbi:MAG: radical SAM protein [Candidatus Helarchaeota archaeon]